MNIDSSELITAQFTTDWLAIIKRNFSGFPSKACPISLDGSQTLFELWGPTLLAMVTKTGSRLVQQEPPLYSR